MIHSKEFALEEQYVMTTFARKPVEFVRGRGMTLIDVDGREYLDFLAGIGVVSLGHCHPAVVRAVCEQAEKLIHVGNYYYIEKRGEVAGMLSGMLNATLPENRRTPWKTFFANSGAEANECAIKLARLYAHRQSGSHGVPADEAPNLIVTLENSFHGRTLATLAATMQEAKQEAFRPLPGGFLATPLNDIEALEHLFKERGGQICAIMLECIQGEAGVYPCTTGFLQAARAMADEYGALLICDEIQCGLFRTGRAYAFQQAGILPDIVTMAKGIASGVVAAACSARADVASAFEPGDHGSTFGGSNLAMAAAFATLLEMLKPSFGEQVEKTGAYLKDCLRAFPQISAVRGVGLMVAADLASSAPPARKVVDAGLEAGLVLNATGQRTLRFLPPLICERCHVDLLHDRLQEVFQSDAFVSGLPA